MNTIKIIEKWLKSPDCDVRSAAMNACQGRDVPIELIEKGLQDKDCDVRIAAMNACQGRDVPLELIEKGLQDPNWSVRFAAMNACQGRDVPIELIEKWLQDSDWHVRHAAMNACQGRDVPVELIEKGLRDPDCDVRYAAEKLLKKEEALVELIRTIEPPETVYKKCLGNVIVCASIPKDAQVRGSIGNKCRASKAVITDIIGTFGGERVGVSKYDGRVLYFVGDTVEIENFDMSNEECSSGFHFFCTMDEARMY